MQTPLHLVKEADATPRLPQVLSAAFDPSTDSDLVLRDPAPSISDKKSQPSVKTSVAMDDRGFSVAPLLEIACFDEESAVNAAKGGADRIELCRDYGSGGLSPAARTLTQLKSLINIPVFVMIRPHSKSFCYDQESFEVMKSTLTTMKHLGADGFVFGILRDPDESFSKNTSSWIDVARNKELIELAEGKPCTFHRAFDCIPESYWDTALADLIRCGFASILTSGGPSSDRAIDCVDRLANLAHRLDRLMIRSLVNHKPLQIIVGGGVRSDNIRILGEKSQARAFHSSARVSSSETVAISEVRMLRAMLQADSLQPYSTAPNET